MSRSVCFTDYPSISSYETDGELWPYTASSRRFAQEFPVDYVPKFDERAVSDATLVGAMHEAMVKDMLKGTKTSCKFQCDSDFGCDSCIPACLLAEPEKPEIPLKREMLLFLIYQWILPTFHGSRTLVLLRICCRGRMRRMGAFTNHLNRCSFLLPMETISVLSTPTSRSSRPIALFGHMFLMRLQPCYPWV